MKKETKTKLIKLLIVATVMALIFFVIYFSLKWSGLLDRIDDLESLKQVIKEGGIFSALIFFVLQFLQVTILPIPSFITTLAGAFVFGPYVASTISFIAIFLGSLFAFYLGKKYGKKLVCWILGNEEANKWQSILTKGKYAFFLMMLFPIFPDDMLCLVAGLTNMSYKFFIITNLITRPIAILCTCFLGSGYLIPFSGAGIIIWIILLVVLLTLFIISIKYQKQINEKIELWGQNIAQKVQAKKPLKTENKIEINKENTKNNNENN